MRLAELVAASRSVAETSGRLEKIDQLASLRDLVAEALRRILADQPAPERKRMTEAPVRLPPGHTIPIRSNSEIAKLFEQEDIAQLNDVYRRR